jgi:hypothetical protein
MEHNCCGVSVSPAILYQIILKLPVQNLYDPNASFGGDKCGFSLNSAAPAAYA